MRNFHFYKHSVLTCAFTTPTLWFFVNFFLVFKSICFALGYLLGVQLHVSCCKTFSSTPIGKKVTPLLPKTPRWVDTPPLRIFHIKFLPLGDNRFIYSASCSVYIGLDFEHLLMLLWSLGMILRLFFSDF